MPKIFKGCELVDASQLDSREFYPQVPTTRTHYPLPHIDFYYNASRVLRDIGIGIITESFGLSPQRDRMFMWLETDAQINELPLCIGGRNSYDKSMSTGLCVGTKIMVCSNKVLASYENGGVVSRKHTSAENIDELSREFTRLVQDNTSLKPKFFDSIQMSKDLYMADSEAKESLVDLVLNSSITPTDIPLIWNEFKKPSYEHGVGNCTEYNFVMACTEVFKLHKGADYQIRAYDGVAKLLGL